MANKITTTVYDACGNSYATDVYVRHNVKLPDNLDSVLKFLVIFEFYKTETDYNNGRTAIGAVKDNTDWERVKNYMQTITSEQFPNLSNSMIQGFVTTYLESIWGEGNCPVVT